MRSRIIPTWIRVWNRKLHFYVGLYLILFLWLFSVSGLLLNHSAWRFAGFWPQRQESSWEQTVEIPPSGDDLEKAKHLMRQLGLHGQIRWTEARPPEGPFRFRVERPGNIADVHADLQTGQVSVKRLRFNEWGKMRILHVFTGVSMEDPQQTRNWVMTHLWSLCMDALALGAVFLVLSGVYMWYQLTEKRLFGLIALGAGLLVGGFFVFGLRML